jgi:sphingomyelin phosphodiesterase
MAQVQGLAVNPTFSNNSCALCITVLEIAKLIALATPEQGPAFFVFLCQEFQLTDNIDKCDANYGATTFGSVLTQVLANADVAGYDGTVGDSFSRCPRKALT